MVQIAAIRGFRVNVSPKTVWLMLRLTFADGSEGWGEATHFGAEAELANLVAGLADHLRQAPAPGLAALQRPLIQAQMTAPRRALMSALEQAWLDGAARRAGLPLSLLLGGDHREQVPFYANINRGIADRSPDGFAAQAVRIVAETGARAVKIAPFDGLRWDRSSAADMARLTDVGLDRVAAVRAALPVGTLLMVDCHARFDPFHARGIFAALAAQDVFWVEEPCDMATMRAADQRGLRGAANDRGLRLAGAEDLTGPGDMARLLAAGGHDVVLPDLRLTGVAGGIAMLRLAAEAQVAVSLHNPVGPVLDAVSIQVAAALPSFLILERQVGETPLSQSIRGGAVTISGGDVMPDTAPGLGFVPDLKHMVPLCGDAARLSFAGMAGAGPDA
jgi:galactonate dehydratase